MITATICGHHGWYEDSNEGIADHHRAGIARVRGRVQITIGRTDRRERLGHVRRPIVRSADREAREARPLFGIFPTKLESKIFGVDELRFDQASRGAEIGRVGHDRLELRADGWDLFIETDDEGRVAPETRLVFQLELAEKQRKLRCRPADPASGYLDATTRAGSYELDGGFLVELATCEDVETGRVIDWPSSPLTLRGSFEGLPQGLNRGSREVKSPLD